MKLLIDNREPNELIEIFKSRLQNIELKNLDIGDFQILDNNDKVIMLFERKSLSDLISSIKDGRYNEQSFRLTEHPLDNHSIYYIIEGNLKQFINKNNETNIKMLYSSILSLSYIKNFSILTCNNQSETAEFIIRFFEKMEKTKKIKNLEKVENMEKLENVEKVETLEKIEKPEYIDSIKISKKSHITKDNINEIMLAQIPGISINISKSLMEQFKTVKNLVECLEKDEKCLDNYKINSKSGERKLNKNVIKSLSDYLLIKNE